jgi:ABC-2 type transport system ATP-binding protein
MIEVRELSKSYGPHKAIDRLSFSVKKGEIVGFLGPNGAGKTTTMKIITGFMAPTEGSVTVAGFDVFEDPLEVKRRIGYLPETPPVYGEMSVESYLQFVARLKGVEKSKLKAYVERAIEKTDLGSVRHRLIQNLSKGYRQRVGISQALVSDPEVLILDEPTVGLDPRQVAEVRELIRSLAGEHTVVLSTHILPEVQATCQRIIIINRGRIVAEDSLNGLSRRITGSSRIHLRVGRASADLTSRLSAVSGVTGVHETKEGSFEVDTDGTKDVVATLAERVVTSGAGLYELREETFNLEDVFLRLTTSEETQGPSSYSNDSAGQKPREQQRPSSNQDSEPRTDGQPVGGGVS